MKKLCLAIFCFFALGANLEAKAERVFKLRSDGELFGPAVTYMSESGILIQCKVGKTLWQAKNPGSVTMINDEYKTYLTVPVQEYLTELRGDSPAPQMTNLITKPEVFLKSYKGRKTESFIKPGADSNDLVARIGTIDSPIKNKEVNRMWCKYFGVNRFDIGLPVLLEQKLKRGVSDMALAFISGKNGQSGKSDQFAKLAKNKDLARGKRKQKWVEDYKATEITFAEMDKNTFEIRSNWRRAKDRPSLYLSQDGDIKQSDIDDLFFRQLK